MQPWCGASYPMVPNLPQPMAFEGSAGKRSWNLGGHILRLGIILEPSILSREIVAKTFWHHRHFGMCTIRPCKHFNTWTFGSLDISIREYFSTVDVLAQIFWHRSWMFQLRDVSALLPTIMVVPTMDISAKKSTCLNVQSAKKSAWNYFNELDFLCTHRVKWVIV